MKSRQEMSRRSFLCRSGYGLAGLALGAAGAHGQQVKRPPNIIFILSDDLGWRDTAIYGSAYYETPNIDRLAERGMLFTDAYAANPLCSPTRASVMTGKYPGRLKLTSPSGHLPTVLEEPIAPDTGPPKQKVLAAESRTQLPLEEYTLAEALKDAGYGTAFLGKWHLGREKFWPDKQGFDVNVAGAQHPGPPSYFSPYDIETIKDGPEGEYITDRLTDEALAYIEQQKDNPFLLCFWHFGVHSPWQAKEELVAHYRDKEDPRGEQNNPYIAAIVHSIDESVGRLTQKLDELGLTDNTLVIFTSDNGQLTLVPGKKGAPRRNSPLKGGDPVSSNAPLRAGKGCIYEGGVRVPAIFSWPGHIPQGVTSEQVISSIDYYPTLLEIAGAAPKPGQVIDGVDLSPVLFEGERLDREAIFCHFPHTGGAYTEDSMTGPATSVRQGRWKLIRIYWEGEEQGQHRYELYDLADDIGETNNLAAEMPDKVRELDALISQYLEETGSLVPQRNKRYQGGGGNAVAAET